MDILDRIKNLCKERNITVKMVEEDLNFPNNTIYQWRKRVPNTDKLQKLADYFDVSTDYLLGRTDVKRFSDSIETIAAHHDGEEWTKEELEEIERFKQFVKLKRKEKGE
ncbi:helix-turn-helix domain-containing protein [Rossellomorea marisflavi]|uniref:helix-turn-helix domain-containing protein n=1 Tax=Rossellomorea marisflavi TaxID=189381 RepID=UPI003D2EC457